MSQRDKLLVKILLGTADANIPFDTKSASYTPFSTSAANFSPSPRLLEKKGVIKTDLV